MASWLPVARAPLLDVSAGRRPRPMLVAAVGELVATAQVIERPKGGGGSTLALSLLLFKNIE